jgi:ribonuclease E
LIPNKGLETPNYKLERLKHDDPRLDNIQASYKMAEEIEDPTAVTRRSQEPTNKQTPVIKGVLPDLPAPHAEPRAAKAEAAAPSTPAAKRPSSSAAAPAEKGFFGWLKNLFGGDSTNEPAKPATTDKPARSGERREGRSGEGRGEGRSGDNRRGGQRRGEPRRSEARGEGREERPSDSKTDNRTERPEGGREGGRGRGRGGDRRRQEAPVADTADVASDAVATPVDTAERPPREKTDGRRGRGRRGDRPTSANNEASMASIEDHGTHSPNDLDQHSNNATPAEASPAANEGGERVNERRERRNRDRYGRDRAPRADKTDDSQPATVDNAWSPQPAAPVAAATPAPAVHRMPSIGSYELPMTQLQQVATGSGLEWVNSKPESIAQVQAAIAAEPKPVHVPRERPAPIVIDEGPLVLVETKRDLRQMHMPFDEQGPTA